MGWVKLKCLDSLGVKAERRRGPKVPEEDAELRVHIRGHSSA